MRVRHYSDYTELDCVWFRLFEFCLEILQDKHSVQRTIRATPRCYSSSRGWRQANGGEGQTQRQRERLVILFFSVRFVPRVPLSLSLLSLRWGYYHTIATASTHYPTTPSYSALPSKTVFSSCSYYCYCSTPLYVVPVCTAHTARGRKTSWQVAVAVRSPEQG